MSPNDRLSNYNGKMGAKILGLPELAGEYNLTINQTNDNLFLPEVY
jgi:hypothetical protein